MKDEKDSIAELVFRIRQVFEDLDHSTACLREIIFIDDGSTDQTWHVIREMASSDLDVVGIRLRRNFGKAAALQAGIDLAVGDIIVTMDGDLQDDPTEIPRFLEAIRGGSDVVSGWKQIRHDPLDKTLPSRIFNKVTAWVTGVKLHDFNCGFKAYHRSVFDDVRLYGELHRFIPALAHSLGFTVSEIPVQHHPRRFGSSKYGIGRLLKGFLDLLTVVTITKFNSRPGHLFGGLGVVSAALGLITFTYLVLAWLGGEAIGNRPLLIISTLLMTVGVQFMLFGMVAELIVATKSATVRPNTIKELVGANTASTTGHLRNG